MNLLWHYIRQQKKVLFGALVLATINQVFSLLDPQVFRLLVDNYASKASELSRSEFFQGVGLLLLATMGVALVSRVAKNFQDYCVNIVTQRVGARMYSESVAHSFSLPYAAFEDQRSGELLQKLQKARTDSQQLIMGMVNVLFLSLVGIIFVVAYASTVHWSIGVVYFLIIPVVGSVTFFLSRRIKNAQKEIVAQTGALAGSTTETLRNVELVKSLGLEHQETERLNQVNEKILGLELKKIRQIRMLSFIQGTTINAVRSGMMLLMLWLIFQGTITLGEFFSLLFYSFFVFGPLAELGNIANTYQETRASMERLQQILATRPEAKPTDPKTIGALETIEFREVSFTHAAGTSPAVTGLNFTIPKSTTVAFVGPSGAGKSTTLKLLVGLYRPTTGQMLVNGQDAQAIDYEALRRRIGYVSQDTQLFAGTIRENLLFVNPSATDQECLTALKNASAMAIIERARTTGEGGNGLDVKIGEGGIKISGGERQRLAIARALLRNPDLIIFDEATSSLDSLTEKDITQTIKEVSNLKPNLMTVMVAHRLSTIAHADIIYVLERGALIEQGTHTELLETKGLYAALWREQGATPLDTQAS